jgi:hypothetical protein
MNNSPQHADKAAVLFGLHTELICDQARVHLHTEIQDFIRERRRGGVQNKVHNKKLIAQLSNKLLWCHHRCPHPSLNVSSRR